MTHFTFKLNWKNPHHVQNYLFFISYYLIHRTFKKKKFRSEFQFYIKIKEKRYKERKKKEKKTEMKQTKRKKKKEYMWKE